MQSAIFALLILVGGLLLIWLLWQTNPALKLGRAILSTVVIAIAKPGFAHLLNFAARFTANETFIQFASEVKPGDLGWAEATVLSVAFLCCTLLFCCQAGGLSLAPVSPALPESPLAVVCRTRYTRRDLLDYCADAAARRVEGETHARAIRAIVNGGQYDSLRREFGRLAFQRTVSLLLGEIQSTSSLLAKTAGDFHALSHDLNNFVQEWQTPTTPPGPGPN